MCASAKRRECRAVLICFFACVCIRWIRILVDGDLKSYSLISMASVQVTLAEAEDFATPTDFGDLPEVYLFFFYSPTTSSIDEKNYVSFSLFKGSLHSCRETGVKYFIVGVVCRPFLYDGLLRRQPVVLLLSDTVSRRVKNMVIFVPLSYLI